jgi:AAA domain
MSFVAGPGYVSLPRGGGAWVVEDLLPVSGLLNIFGQPKKGKSFLAMQIAEAIGNPNVGEVLGFPIRTHGPVAYLQIDTPRGLWAERIESLRYRGLGFEQVFFADTELVPYPFDVLKSGFGWLEENLKLLDPMPVAIVVDTLREAHGGDENDSGHMRNVINLLVKACAPAAIVLLSHARKEWGEGGDLMSDNRGSSYVAGRMDCVMKVSDNSLVYQGRTVGEGRTQIKRDEESGIFLLNDDFDRGARDVIQSNQGVATLGLAKLLQERYPKKTLEACRSIIRRLQNVKRSPRPVDRSEGGQRKIELDETAPQPAVALLQT